MSLLKDLEDGVITLEHEAVEVLRFVGKETILFFSAAMKAFEASGGTPVGTIITNAVIAESKTSGTGAQKFASAIASIGQDLAAQGIKPIANAVNAGLEAAVAALPANQPQPVIAPSAVSATVSSTQ